MYVSTVLVEKHSSQSITLVALKSCWCSSKSICSWGGGLIFRFISLQNKHEPLLIEPISETTKNKIMLKNLSINRQNVLQNNAIFTF